MTMTDSLSACTSALRRPITHISFVLLPWLGSLACGDLVGNAELPAGVKGPNTYNTPAGALGVYRGTQAEMASALTVAIKRIGLLTDELTAFGLGSGPQSIGAVGDPIDERVINPLLGDPGVITALGADPLYGGLHAVRGNAAQAIGLLASYAPETSPALRGEMYALEGYAETMLAEVYCSGVPLSTLNFQSDFTYKPSSSSTEIYTHAVALFDSALAISSDSLHIMWLASVGKARALQGLGQYAQAGQAVATVPDTFQYAFSYAWFNGFGNDLVSSVSSREGRNGIPFYTSDGTSITDNDPRSWVVPGTPDVNRFGVPQFVPAKYPNDGTPAPVVLASGVEARLIQAEAALRAGSSSWLTILNALRTDGTVASTYTRLCQNGIAESDPDAQPGSPCPSPSGTSVDTTWGPGSGIGLIPASVQADIGPVCETAESPGVPCTDTVWYKGLHPITDPGLGTLPSGKTAVAVRVDLLFQERAFWLFLTGHREGDMRRLIRQYGRAAETVYPSGPYYGGFGSYGDDVNFPIRPIHEQDNPLFHGCLDREA